MPEITNNNVTIQNILDGKKDFLSLDFNAHQDRDIALQCLEKNQLLARKLNIAKPAQLDLLKEWLVKKYEYMLILKPEQRCKELVDIYLGEKYKEQLSKWSGEGDPLAQHISLMYSYTKQQILGYTYETKKGEEVSYFDDNLGVPIKLKSEINIKLKLVDALRLVKKIDIELERVDLGLTVKVIHNALTDCLRSSILSVIEENNLSYYDLPKHLPKIKEVLAASLKLVFDRYGLYISELKINDISLTNDMEEQLEQQYIALAKISRVKEFEYKQEEQSLKLYEKKARIHAAYPDFQLGLTEAEKDLALERYLKRVGEAKEVTTEVKHKELGKALDTDGDVSSTTISAPVPPVAPASSKKYRIWYSISVVLWAVLCAVFLSMGEELLTFGIVIAIVGFVALLTTGILLRYQLKYGMSKKTKDSYDEQLKIYNKQLDEYNHHGSRYFNKPEDQVNDVPPAQPEPPVAPEQK